jgi:hypothetical protein
MKRARRVDVRSYLARDASDVGVPDGYRIEIIERS